MQQVTAQPCTYTNAHMNAYILTHAHTHTHAHTLTHTHTHTDTHTNWQTYFSSSRLQFGCSRTVESSSTPKSPRLLPLRSSCARLEEFKLRAEDKAAQLFSVSL